MTDIFEALIPTPDDEIDVTKNYAEELIGDGKKYSDVDQAARALAEKELHIKRIERENAALRQTSAAQQKLEDLVTRLSERSPSNEPVAPVVNGTEPDVQPLDLEAKLNEIVAKREAAARQAANAETVKKKLHETFGPNYVSHLSKEAERLGMTTEQMNQLAVTSPTAFLKLVGAERTSTDSGISPPRPSVVPNVFNPKGVEKTRSYYKKLAASNRELFLKRETQLEMLSQAKRLGEAFYDA